MKKSKPATQVNTQEECGVWLDPVQLKGNAKKKRLARPVSKLLNPLARGSGYSLAVALNFTQTKMEMPKTKQSSISSFFTRQSTVPSEKPTSEVPDSDSVQSSSSCTSTATARHSSAAKRRRGMCPEEHDYESDVDQERRSETVTEPEATLLQEPSEAQVTTPHEGYNPSEKAHSDELDPPESQGMFLVHSSFSCDSQPPPLTWSQDPLLTFSQYTDSELSQSDQIVKDSELDAKGRTSTQKCSKKFSSIDLEDEKENSGYLSPSRLSSFSHSNHEWTKPKTASPRKPIARQPSCHALNEKDSYKSPFKRSKISNSPLKTQGQKRQSEEEDDLSLSTLFTQDSEGFRVIAHRGLRVRSPLKESNASLPAVRSVACKSFMAEDEEDEMLFTQDSQGNMVIKH